MILTQGEKMVWAAAFVNELERNMDCFSLGLAGAEARAVAMKRTCVSVLAFRRTAKEAEDAFDHDKKSVNEESLLMLRAMLGDEG